jgi:hypothetical protein
MDVSWWEHMATLEHVYWIIAVAGSVVLLVQLVMAFASGLDFHVEGDVAAHSGTDINLPHFQLLTIRNVVAFFVIFGWVGIAMIHANATVPLTIIVSFCCGLIMMVLVAAIFVGLSKLQTSGNGDVSLAKGSEAQVYLTIPPARKSGGKIEVVLQGKKVEMDALTDDSLPLLTGVSVKIKEVLNNQAIVERK